MTEGKGEAMRTAWGTLVKGMLLVAAAFVLFNYTIYAHGYGGNPDYRFREFMYLIGSALLLALAYFYPALHAARARKPGKWRVIAWNAGGAVFVWIGITSVDVAFPAALAGLAGWGIALFLAGREPVAVRSADRPQQIVGLKPYYGDYHHVDMDDPVWVDMVRGVNEVVDAIRFGGDRLKGIGMLRQAAARHGGDAMVASLHAHLGDDISEESYELYLLARAGVREAIPSLMKNLASYDDDVVREAAFGLAHLGEQVGFDTIAAVLDGTAPPDDLRNPYDWYLDLEGLDEDWAKVLVDQYRERDWSIE